MIILIVDDDEGTLLLRSRQLAPLGEVRSARSMREALLEMSRIPPPDFILLDLIFAGPEPQCAETTLNQIKLIKDKNPHAVVLVTTGSIDEELPDIALSKGASHFVHKKDTPTQRRLFEACQEAFSKTGGQHMLDNLNRLLTPFPSPL